MTSGSFASSYVETVRLLDPPSHNFRTLSVRNPRNSVAKYPLFLRNTLTPAPRHNVARYRWLVAGGWCLVAGGWWLVAGGWWLVAGGWWLVAGGWWLQPD